MNINVSNVQLTDDVRHVGPDDVQSSVAQANVSRSLANRDQQLADAFNDLLAALKNAQIPTPIVLLRTSVPSLQTVWVGNFRIPAGYEASVVNASVSSAPIDQLCQLQVIHSAGTFGQNGSGDGVTVLVNTTSEYKVAGNFVGEGELIFKFVSTSTQRIAVSASVSIILKQLVIAGSSGTATTGGVT